MIDSESDKLLIYNENPIFHNWNNSSRASDLINYILPSEDIEDRGYIEKNLKTIENYNFDEIIKKYAIENFIINIVYKKKNNLKVLSKMKLDGNYKVVNKDYQNINLKNEESRKNFLYKLRNIYEDNWKELNIINTSIKLPVTISLPSKDEDKIKLFEKLIDSLDLISNSYILSFDSDKIYYKIIYNGEPKKLLNTIKDSGLELANDKKNWNIK